VIFPKIIIVISWSLWSNSQISRRTGGRWVYWNMLARAPARSAWTSVSCLGEEEDFEWSYNISMIKKAIIQTNEKTTGQSERLKEQERLMRVQKWFDEKWKQHGP